MAKQNRHNGNTITGPKYAQHPEQTRAMPWEVMGDALKPAHATNLDKALKAARMDYEVAVWDVAATGPDGTVLEASKSQALVRTDLADGPKVVGVTGTRFTPIHNRDAFAVAQDLVGDFGARIDGLADFRHGGASVLALALPAQDVVVRTKGGGEDRTGMHLLIKNAHDGSAALTFAITPVRFACTNVLPMAFKQAQRVWKVNHTPNAMERVALAEAAIREAVGFHDALQVTAQAMADTKMIDAEFARIVARMIPVQDDATGAVAERKRETRAQIVNLYRDSETLDGIRGTLWGGYNAMTEYLDHFRPVKGGEAAEALARAEGAIDGPNVRVKTRMWETFAQAV